MMNGKEEYENFEIAHFRLLADTNWLPYGKSMIENGRRLWKQLSLMEDGMLIHRIMSSQKREFSKLILVISHQQKLITICRESSTK